jgi:ketoreductase
VNKIAVVSGVSRGIGCGIVRQLADDGTKVFMIARHEEKLNLSKKEFDASGYDTVACPCDITDRAALKALIEKIIADAGRIDILVNCAGLMPFPATLLDTEDQLFDDMVAVNLTGTYNVTKAVLPHMIGKKYGRIVNISSVSARKTVGMFVGYAAAKGALHAFTAALANEVMKDGITVNCVLPGFTETDEMHRIWGTIAEQAGITEDEILAPFWAQVPLGRWITPDEIGHTVAFLCSDKAAVVTGQMIKADGGYDNHE